MEELTSVEHLRLRGSVDTSSDSDLVSSVVLSATAEQPLHMRRVSL